MPSPASPPSIRTDWLADVAWRIAAFGLDELRTLSTDQLELLDFIDGEPWRLTPTLWSSALDGAIDFDGDLHQPTDQGPPTLRLGGSLTPVWSDEHGRQVQVRIEIGPRGPVVFDPENWVYSFPLTALLAGERPAVAGVDGGDLVVQDGSERQPLATPGELADLPPAGAVWLGDLVEIAEGRRSWQAVIGLGPQLHRPRRLGIGRPKLAEPSATLTLTAEGELRVSPLAPLAGDSFAEVQPAGGIELSRDRVEIAVTGGGVPGDRLTIEGPGLRVAVHRLAGG